MKIKYYFIIYFLIVSANLFCQSAKPDTLYFCREYKNGEEIGLSNTFGIGPGGDSITVMIKTNGPIKQSHVSISVDRSESGEYVHIGTHKFDVEQDWDYIFFAGINFWKEGYYKVSLLKEDGSVITYNYVTMVLINGKSK